MTEAPVTIKGMSLEEFIRRSEQEGPFELIDGEIIPKMPTVFGHGKRANHIAFAINLFSKPKQMGEAFVETTFIRPEDFDANWVKGSRIPDVMYLTQERIEMYQQMTEDYDAKPLMLIPDLAIEIVSPNDSYTDINVKVSRYLRDGVRTVWVVDPQVKTVTIHTPDSNHITFLSGDVSLTAGDVIPGFEIKLSELFA
jgi:Uma2 family endonuclease